MRCPKCGNDYCQVITETNTSGKDFSVGKGLCGALLMGGPIGLLCGFCGRGKQISTETFWVCNHCGYKWKH